MLLFAPHHSGALAGRIADALGTPLSASEEREFDGGEHKMCPLQDVRGRDVVVIQSLNGDAQASANDKLCRLLFFIGALKDAGAGRVTACVPYLAYARKDRRTQPRDPVTTRYVAALFEAVAVDRVIVLDVHNEAAFDNAFRCETIRVEAAGVFAAQLAQRDAATRLVVASPDPGGVKRAQRFREALEQACGRSVDFSFMEKRRALGVVSGETFTGDVGDSNVVIYDDLIASGTTLLRAVHAARSAGARRIDVIATHAAFLPAATQLFTDEGPDSVMVSDSIALPDAFVPLLRTRLTVCPIAPLLARTIGELAHQPD
ncbi:MAG TPA: ribose-phosphate diphosphokinase [Steroidobacteraceae bacterium]|nr:ribose-phosphate diphosphokinase [Steroidobacteraceae bacterium]